MKPIKVIHFADLHYSPERQEPALKSLDALIGYCKRERPDLIAFAGDLFDHGVQNSEKGGMPVLLDRFAQLLEIAPIVAVRGTPTHDVAGCYEPLARIFGLHQFVMVEAGKPLYLRENGRITDSTEWRDISLLILGCPEPSKEWWLADKNGLGRDEANQAVVDGMRALLLGLGALRKQHAQLPCLMLYHGQVAGASLANGQTLRPGGIQIGRDDLALVDPDIVACYSGSCFPVNWGERDQKNLLVVTFAGNETYGALGDIHLGQQVTRGQGVIAIDRIPFPHPPRRKLVTGPSDNVSADDIAGCQVWHEIHGTKEDLAAAGCDDLDGWLDQMLAMGALPGSRVTTTVIPTETVRAGNIAEAPTLADKLRIYAQNSGDGFLDDMVTAIGRAKNIIDKAAQLEAEAHAAGLAPDGLHIRIRKLVLRGAIGIWKGQGKDEIELDLDDYDEGLIALVGANGEGKTTLLENMHPYPQMLTRQGKLQDHFRLRDSFRDLYFTDERSGDQYRALLQIDGQNASGSVEYHLYKDGTPLVNGRKADYEEAIAKLFGSLALYLRSAFVSQRPTKSNPDLAAATQGERKALFRELAGLDYLQAYAQSARDRGKALEEEAQRERGKIDVLTSAVAKIPAIEADAKAKEEELEEAAAVVGDLLDEGREAKTRVDALKVIVDRNALLAQQAYSLDAQVISLQTDLLRIANDRAALQGAINLAPKAREQIAHYEDLKKIEEAERAKESVINARRAELTAEHSNAAEVARNIERALQREISAIDKELADENARVAGLKAEIKAAEALVAKPLTENCPKCGQPLPEDQKEPLRKERANDERALEEKRAQLVQVGSEIERLSQACTSKNREIAAIVQPTAPSLPTFDATELDRVRSEAHGIAVDAARKVVEAAATAQARIEEGDKRTVLIAEQIRTLEAQAQELRSKIDAEAEQAYAIELPTLEKLREDYQEATARAAALKAALQSVQEALIALGQQEADLGVARSHLAHTEAEIQEWAWLERACGLNGIQALELDALAPSIADVANRLLSAAYESRFAIEFRTTRLGGSGKNTRQIEDFEVVIHDAQDGSEQALDTLSGGESVWIRRAIYDAFSVIRERNTGTRFFTVFQDESDSALDPDSRQKYIRMIEAAHIESGRAHTLLITHSPEAQEYIAQRIVMRELAGKKEAVAG